MGPHEHKQDVKRRRARCKCDTPTKDPFKKQESLQGLEMCSVYTQTTRRAL